MKKLMIAIIASSVLSGCGGSNNDTPLDNDQSVQSPASAIETTKYSSFQPKGSEKVTIMDSDSPLLVNESNYNKIVNDFGFNIEAIKHYCLYYMISNSDKATSSVCLYDEDKGDFYYSTATIDKNIKKQLILGFNFKKNSPTQEPYLKLIYLTKNLNLLELTSPIAQVGYYHNDAGFQFSDVIEYNTYSDHIEISESNTHLVSQTEFEKMANSEKTTFMISGYNNAGLKKTEEVTIEHMEMLKGFYRDIASKYYNLNQQ